MANKRNRKRSRSRTEELKRQAEQEKRAGEKDRAKKRMDPTARTLLLGDLVFLAVVSLLEANGLVSDWIGGLCTIIGVVLLLAALWFQFGNRGSGTGPRL